MSRLVIHHYVPLKKNSLNAFFFHRKEKNGDDLLKIFKRDNMIINAVL